MSSDQAEVCAAEAVVFGEVTQNYPSKELASKAACAWAKVDDPNKLVLYTRYCPNAPLPLSAR